MVCGKNTGGCRALVHCIQLVYAALWRRMLGTRCIVKLIFNHHCVRTILDTQLVTCYRTDDALAEMARTFLGCLTA